MMAEIWAQCPLMNVNDVDGGPNGRLKMEKAPMAKMQNEDENEME
jgi:hypothetical protein